jgi:hypothetical protein
MVDLPERLEQMAGVSGLRVCLEAAAEIRRLRESEEAYRRLRAHHTIVENEVMRLRDRPGAVKAMLANNSPAKGKAS